MKILIAPYAAKVPDGRLNAKNYPWWPELIKMLVTDGHEVIQIGRSDETRIEGVSQFVTNWPLDKLVQLIRECDRWVSVDSFLPHLCATMRLPAGVVIWSQSDPKIWGYRHNCNLLKSREYLRQFQFAPWYEAEFNEDAFVPPQTVRDAIYGRLSNSATA